MRIQAKTRMGRFIPSLLAAALLLGASPALASLNAEQHFDTLTIGTQTYSNVTVTTRNKSYVFFLHSAGMMNVKVAELSLEEKEMLGYEQKKPATNAAVAWAKTTLKKIETPQVQQIEKKLQAGPPPELLNQIKSFVSLPMLVLILALIFACYLFFCNCCRLICKKAGSEPGALVWIPILQMFPLLKAAKMSPVWFIASLLPILNIITHLVWCIKISQARGKSFWTAICLILPFTSFFAFLYLAFSNGVGSAEEDPKRSDVLVLGAA